MCEIVEGASRSEEAMVVDAKQPVEIQNVVHRLKGTDTSIVKKVNFVTNCAAQMSMKYFREYPEPV